MSNLTTEQQSIINHLQSNKGTTLVQAIAGAGKTTLLKAISTSIPNSNSLYLSYNSEIAKSSRSKFPSTVDCRTVHSLAYQATVKPFSLNVGFFNPKHMTEAGSYNSKLDFIEAFREFCLSRAESISAFFSSGDYPKHYTQWATKYFNAMHKGKIDCTHDFYLKLYHLLLVDGDITYPTFDLLLWDEIQDMAPVASAIFELLPATYKVGVGDPFQAIYSFNHTVNYFDLAPKDTPIFTLSQSFRVPSHIATKIDHFCKSYLDPNMSFNGVPSTSSTITTRAYLTRTNSALISRMVELNEQSIPYTLVRKADEIFKLPLILCGLKPRSFISAPEYRHLQEHVDDWYSDPFLKMDYKSPLSYIGSLYPHDVQLKQAIRLIARYGAPTIVNTFKIAKTHVNAKTNYTLATAHSVKGAEFDDVTIAHDLNESIAELTLDIRLGHKHPSQLSISERESLNLYYVAVSRTLVTLNNATQL